MSYQCEYVITSVKEGTRTYIILYTYVNLHVFNTFVFYINIHVTVNSINRLETRAIVVHCVTVNNALLRIP